MSFESLLFVEIILSQKIRTDFRFGPDMHSIMKIEILHLKKDELKTQKIRTDFRFLRNMHSILKIEILHLKKDELNNNKD